MGKYLKFYKKHLPDGLLPNPGLCNCFGTHTLELFEPEHGKGSYWAFDGENDYWALDYYDDRVITHCFTPLRQNIVLFLAVMNGEL